MANRPTRITGNTSTLIDHILTNGQNNISQSGVINIAISDHNMIHCTRRISKDTIQSIYFCSLRNYPVDVYKQTLERVLFPNQKSFDNFDLALSDIVNRLNCLVNAICSLKTV